MYRSCSHRGTDFMSCSKGRQRSVDSVEQCVCGGIIRRLDSFPFDYPPKYFNDVVVGE